MKRMEERHPGHIKLSLPPIWIYIPSDAQLSPPSFGIFKVYVDMENLFLL